AFWSFAQTPGWWRPSALVAVAPLIVLLFNLLHLTGSSPFWGLDPSPIGISIGMAFVAIAVFRYRAFELVPIPRGEIYDRIDSAIITVDLNDVVIDANQRAREIFDTEPKALFGTPLADFLPPSLLSEVEEASGRDAERVIEVRDRYLESAVQHLDRRDGNLGGRVLSFRDVTERHRAELALLEAQQQLAEANAELRTLAHTDPLTGLANRRSLMERLEHELQDAEPNAPLGVLMLDLDRFKRVNDVHGHSAGDQVLRATARAVRECLGEDDLAARFGGEELVVLTPASSADELMELAERIRRAIAEARIEVEAGVLSVTVSLGAALSSELEGDDPSGRSSGDALLARADERLYRAKEAGRDRVVGPFVRMPS
ncbi:MAG: diguanylate cyclase, partial [Acidobacteriota bacterium]